MIKEAITETPVHGLIKRRWSPRAFSNDSIEPEEIKTLLEAASWAPSAMNAQPWRYVAAQKGTATFQKMWECMMPGNQIWTDKVAVIILSIGIKTYENGAENKTFMHDVGLANANLVTQGISMGIFSHFIGGFNPDKARTQFKLAENEVPICFIALGYLGDAEQLEEPFKSRELAPRSRKAVDEIAEIYAKNDV